MIAAIAKILDNKAGVIMNGKQLDVKPARERPKEARIRLAAPSVLVIVVYPYRHTCWMQGFRCKGRRGPTLSLLPTVWTYRVGHCKRTVRCVCVCVCLGSLRLYLCLFLILFALCCAVRLLASSTNASVLLAVSACLPFCLDRVAVRCQGLVLGHEPSSDISQHWPCLRDTALSCCSCQGVVASLGERLAFTM